MLVATWDILCFHTILELIFLVLWKIPLRLHWICRLPWILWSFSHYEIFLLEEFFFIIALQCCGGLCCCSVSQSRPTLCGPMDCIMSDFPVFHYFLKLTQTHVHWVGDAIQPSHPLSPPSLLNINAKQYNYIYVCICICVYIYPPSLISLPSTPFLWVAQSTRLGSPCYFTHDRVFILVLPLLSLS